MISKYQKAAKIIQNANAILVGAGAGMGVDSGLPDFRGTKGFWREYPIIKKLNLRFEQMANPAWFTEKPKLAWAFYGHRFNLYKKVLPHKGFYQLLNVVNKKKYGYFVYTSNVDGHFQKAGFELDKIYEVHGSINHLQCVNNCCSEIWGADFDEVYVEKDKFIASKKLPLCKYCGKLARPNILMFGDWSWIADRAERQSQRYHKWLEMLKINDAKLVVIEIGAGKAVPTVRINSQRIASFLNGTIIRINPRESETAHGNIGIARGAAESISEILKYL